MLKILLQHKMQLQKVMLILKFQPGGGGVFQFFIKIIKKNFFETNETTFLGTSALANRTIGSFGKNTAIGYYSLNANTTGNSNTAVGSTSLASNTTGSGNVAIGFRALW